MEARADVDAVTAAGDSDVAASDDAAACGDADGCNAAADNDAYFASYEDLDVHRLMVGDTARTEAYRRAIQENGYLFRDKVVMDVGAGTGILSLFAAEAGARRVYAVEASGIHALARQTVARNGQADVVQVLHGRVEDIQLDATVDVIVSEWMGFYLLHESMLTSVIAARDRFLREGGVLFPCVARLYACPSTLDAFYASHLACWQKPYGLDMTPVGDAARRSMQAAPQVLDTSPDELLAAPELLLELDLSWVTAEDLETFSVRRFVTVTRDGPYRGLCLWFSCQFPGGGVLDTGPVAPGTHWRQTAVVLPRDYPVQRQDAVGFEVTLSQAADAPRRYTIALAMLGDDDEHPVPCGCARGKCRLIKALIDKEDEEFESAGD